MKDSRALSSVQALDDYFDALLDDDVSTDQNTDVSLHIAEESSSLKPQPIVLEPTDKFAGATLTKDKRDLSSVEKLLSQLKLDEDMELQLEEEIAVTTEIETAAQEEVATQTTEQIAVEAQITTDAELDTVVETETVSEVVAELQTETEAATELDVEVAVDTPVIEEVLESADIETETEEQLETQPDVEAKPVWNNIVPDGAFQVLFFESFGVIYAVPLAELGGIHRLEECNHLIGRPDWYLGLQTERDQQLDVVDTAKWVMPEKIADNSHRDDYSYIVILGDSKWGMACDALLGTESLRGEQVRWREQAGKRPWLAGMVKEKMCALIHVEALIAMLNQGIDANALA